MQHLAFFDPVLALALGKVNEKEARVAGQKRREREDAEKKAIEVLQTTVAEAPIEKVFKQPAIADATILLEVTPEQAARCEQQLLGGGK